MGQSISVTRALAEVKSLTDRISRATSEQFVAVIVNDKSVQTGNTVQDTNTTLRANLAKVVDLIERRSKVKAAIVRSNATTKVTVGSKEMTVAEAIEQKSGIVFKQILLQQLSNQLRSAESKAELTNTQVNSRLEALLGSLVGKDRQVTEQEVAAVKEPYLKSNQATVADPNNLSEKIAALQSEIDDFVLNVDFALSEINATTQIEVE